MSAAAAAAAQQRLRRAALLAQVAVVLGTQWGDEGKGKLVDILAQQYDIVARAQVPELSSTQRTCMLEHEWQGGNSRSGPSQCNDKHLLPMLSILRLRQAMRMPIQSCLYWEHWTWEGAC